VELGTRRWSSGRVGDTCDRPAARDDGRRSSATGARGDLGDASGMIVRIAPSPSRRGTRKMGMLGTALVTGACGPPSPIHYATFIDPS
jgi:hypothetical protein